MKKPFLPEGTQPKKKKARKGPSRKIGQGNSYESWNVNPSTGQTMDMFDHQDWMLCDKDCGWCGHCADGVMF